MPFPQPMGYGYGQYTPYTMAPGSRASSIPHPQSSVPSFNHDNSTATATATTTIPTASKQFQSSSHNITFDTDSSDDDEEELEQELNLNYQPDSADLYANNLKMSNNPTTYKK